MPSNDDRANAATVKCSCCGRINTCQRYMLTLLCKQCVREFNALFAKASQE